MKKISQASFLTIITIILIPHVLANLDPYEVIGVKRDASLDQIKKAYRDLVKKLHPDTSNLAEEEASRKFIELNKAFDILRDQNKRKRFDQYGEVDEDRHPRNHNGFNQHQNRQTRDWATYDGFGAFRFSFSSSESHFRKKSITAHKYYNYYLKESKTKPFLIFFYANFCPSCSMIESTWVKITEKLSKFDVGSFSLNVRQEPKLSSDLGASSIPHIACLIDGHVTHYYESELSLISIVKFIKNSLPNNLVPLLATEKEQDRFLGLGPSQNKLSAIIYHNQNNLQLRYLLIAYEFRKYYRFGQISTTQSEYKNFVRRYRVSNENISRSTNFLIFNEDLSKPTMNLGFEIDSINLAQLKKQLYRWPFLQLPKLSSQDLFDDLCINEVPIDRKNKRARLCVILFATDTPSTKHVRNSMIEFKSLNHLSEDNEVMFAFLDPKKQNDFVKALISETKHTSPIRGDESIDSTVILIERHTQDNRKAVHRWLRKRWNPGNLNEIDEAKHELHKLVQDYKLGSIQWQDKVVLTTLVDESGPSFIARVSRRIFDYISRVAYYIVSVESFFTLVILVACAVVTSIFIYNSPMMAPTYGNSPDSPDHDFTQYTKQESSRSDSPSRTHTVQTNGDLKIMELKAETYFGMIRLMKPGFRSIIVLVDRETKDKLLPKFKRAVWPYRRNKTLLFGYLCLDKNLEWYKLLLQQVLDMGELKVNKKNCIGTVLSLNGFKKYFRVYHSKHHEIDSFDDETDNDGSFLGFNEDDVEAKPVSSNQPFETGYTIENSLDLLPIWLDKTFDGLTRRYFIDEWPSEIK